MRNTRLRGERMCKSTVFAFGAHTWNCQFPFSSAVAPSVRVGIESLSLSMLSLVPLALPMDLLKSVSDLRQVYKLLLRVAQPRIVFRRACRNVLRFDFQPKILQIHQNERGGACTEKLQRCQKIILSSRTPLRKPASLSQCSFEPGHRGAAGFTLRLNGIAGKETPSDSIFNIQPAQISCEGRHIVSVEACNIIARGKL